MPEVNLGKVVGPKGSDGAQGPAGADGLSAYEQAQAGGYSGSELEFNQQLAGLSDGPFVPESDKGVASGVATLDSSGKVPATQLPEMNYIPTSQKGAASGVASLDATGKLEETQKPDYTASEVGAVPTTRTVNEKELSADVTLTGEDIPTSASDSMSISSQLSNLAGEKYTKMLADIPQTWDEVWAMPPGIYSWVQLQPITGWQPDDTPSGALRVQLTIHRSSAPGIGGTKTCVLDYVDGATHLTRYFGEESAPNGRWALNATATKPQEFDLPLAEGVTALQPCTYWKNQFEEVTIGGCAANGISDNITIATLPAGFRPVRAVERPATLSGGGERYAGSMLIGTDGAIRIRTTATTNAVVFGATFIAAG